MFNGYHYRNGRNLMNRLKAEAHRMPLFRGVFSRDFFSENALHILRLSHSAASTHIDPFFQRFRANSIPVYGAIRVP